MNVISLCWVLAMITVSSTVFHHGLVIITLEPSMHCLRSDNDDIVMDVARSPVGNVPS